jgi:L-lactate dehydrogenase complex protein LldG
MDPSSQLKLMRTQAEAVQVVVREVADLEEACQYAADLTQKQGGQVVAAPGWPKKKLPSLKKIFTGKGLEFLTENLRSRANDLYTGFTRADYGIAETGSLVLDSTSEDLRLATMLSEVHVVVLPKANLVPDSLALQETLAGRFRRPPCYMSFITGASRTADIERVLTIGVHGPQELHLLLLEEKSK